MASNPQTPPAFKSPYGPPGTPVDTRKLIHFATDGVQPPATLYVDVNDALQLQVNTTEASSVVFGVKYRILEPDGQIISGSHDFQVTAAPRSAQLFRFFLTEGFLLSLETVFGGGTDHRAQTHIRIELQRGSQVQGFSSYVLCQGYVDALTNLSWPPGVHEPTFNGQGNTLTITGTTPAAGAEITEVVPTQARWKLKAFRFQLTTSATVATRGVTFTIDDGANILWQIEAPSTQAASLVQQYNLANIGARADKVFGTNICLPLPADMALSAGYRIRTVTQNLQVGDQYTAPQYSPEEWLGPS